MGKKDPNRNELANLSRLEMSVMGVVWELGDCSSAEVTQAFSRKRPLAPTTIRSVLANLRKKGYLKPIPTIERGFRMRATVKRDAVARSTLGDLVKHLGIPAEERGITFVNGKLAALPGLDVDLSTMLHDGDRVGISHNKAMWPFQYRFGAQLTPELKESFRQREDRGIHHAYTKSEEES